MVANAKNYYSSHPIEFINEWCDTYDPRLAATGRSAHMPLVMFPKQEELVLFIQEMIASGESGLIEKSRDMGATWVSCAISVWLWLYVDGAAIGWGSRKDIYVDKIGDPNSIFEKIRMLLDRLPRELLPPGFDANAHCSYMKIVNPENGAAITGEAGDNIGRGGRSLIYFKDESAHYERPEKIEASLGDNTNTQIDISSVNGLGNVFHNKRENGSEWTQGNVAKNATNVFIMDWKDHPNKTQEWYDGRKAKAELDGMLHIFAQEVERDYSASVLGTIIPSAWIESAIDAHIVVGFECSDTWVGGLDVADGGGDRNALALRKGVVLLNVAEWGARDTGETARLAVSKCSGKGRVKLQYDCIGVGAGVKAESNRLESDGLSGQVDFVAWNAGSSPFHKDKRVIEGDRESPLNKDFYTNLKAQAWWQLRLRFERTHKAVTQGAVFPVDDLISLSSETPNLRTLQKELAQPTFSKNSSMKILVDKQPEGTKSPNLADAVVMCYNPVTKKKQLLSPDLKF
ncbi:MAG: TerL protein [Candidatus Methanofishera endochildressiae]|uniref:TerL protein n=1 Tax=Candidatus Methanofishera endochildressiae TaxID=2738884 RepID=A0A7Z0SCZ0_9GAMM|nr:TerL protein [Candidatus Methanofishera endochildressiae]